MDYKPSEELKEFMFKFLTDEKAERFNRIIEQRTRHITIVLEDVFQPQNTNAVIRSCECFGVQDLHLIQNKYEFELHQDISMGSSQWINLHQHHDGTIACINHLKNKGYRIIATGPHENDVDLMEIPLDQKTAFIIGSEKGGLSKEALDHCDGYMKIPMAGFTESLNLSNCSAIITQTLTHRLWKSTLPWQLTEEEKTAVLIEWCFQVTGRKNLLLEYFENNIQNTEKQQLNP